MLNLSGLGSDASKIDYAKLPVLTGQHALVSRGVKPWIFRQHAYLAFYAGQYWCMWSEGPAIEDKPTQHVHYATSSDGLLWTQDKLVAGPPAQDGYRYISRGFWLRDAQLIALATLDNALAAQGARTPWSADLQLLGFAWDPAGRQWAKPQVISTDTMSNFPPEKLPNGQWAMMRRDHQDNVTFLVGGVDSPSVWKTWNVVGARSDAPLHPAEPVCWVLPDGRLLGLLRDSAGSKRIFQTLSADNGQHWLTPAISNFPDADSKFFGFRTSRGYYVLVSNPNPAGRNPLCLSTSDDGLTFTRMARLPVPVEAVGGPVDVDNSSGTVQYPDVIEHGGQLLIAYSRHKTAVEVIQVSLDEVDRLRQGKL